jgi:hypothetical protein
MTPPRSVSRSAPDLFPESSGAEPGAEAPEAGRVIGERADAVRPARRYPERIEHVLDDDKPCPCGHNWIPVKP